MKTLEQALEKGADAVAATEAITEQEFRRMATWPGVVVRNPGYVFNIGDSQHVASKIDDKEMFQRTITHKDKESDFLRWYNHGGHIKMMFTALSCSNAYNTQLRRTTDEVAQFTLQGKEQQVWITYGSAMQIDGDSTEKSLFECTAKIADLAKPRNP